MPLELDGFQSWVSYGSEEIACHGIEKSEDGKEVTCWIASEEGKKFSIKWTRPAQLARTAMRGKVQVDDIICRGIVMQDSNTPGCIYSRDGFTTSSTTVKPFMFASLKTTAPEDDSNDNPADSTTSTKLGNIKLSIWKVQVTHVGRRTPRALPQDIASHGVKLGTETKRDLTSTNNIKSKKLDTQPMVTFVFKYRPIDVLQANGIVSPPSPIMSPVEKWRKGVVDEHYELDQGEDGSSEEARGPLHQEGVDAESEDVLGAHRVPHALEGASGVNDARAKEQEAEREAKEKEARDYGLQAEKRVEREREMLGGELKERELKARERKRGSWQGDAKEYEAKEREAKEREAKEREALERQLEEREAEERAQRGAVERKVREETAGDATPRHGRTQRGSHTREGASGSGSYDSSQSESGEDDDSGTKQEEEEEEEDSSDSQTRADMGEANGVKVPQGSMSPVSLSPNGKRHHQAIHHLEGSEEGQTGTKTARAGAGETRMLNGDW